MVNSRSKTALHKGGRIHMVAGHLQEKKGYFYIVLSYSDISGKRKTKWIPTSLPVKGNKKKAEKLLMEARREFETECKPIQDDVLFSDFMLQWLEIVKPTIAITTYSSYSNMVKGIIAPYFKERGIMLKQLRPTDIQAFYMEQLKRVKANSVIHYHANIHKALKYAVKIDLLDSNPADKVERPKKNPFMGSFYDSDEVTKLFEAAKGTLLEIPVFLGAFYGLRRSEVLGLKWSAIDFQSNTITIKHTVTSCNLDGKHIQVAQDTTKTKSSLRILPLIPAFREKLLEARDYQKECKRLCGQSNNPAGVLQAAKPIRRYIMGSNHSFIGGLGENYAALGENWHINFQSPSLKKAKRKAYKRHKPACRLIVLAQREGFEPSWDCSQTDFESAPL